MLIITTPVGAAKAEIAPPMRLPVIMYHSILNSRTGRYIVSAGQLESDIKALREAGYNFVSAEEVVDYAEGMGALPDKPVLLTFDDGHYNNMYYGLPVFEKYGAKALFNIIGVFSEYSSTSGDDSNPNYSHLTWSQIGSLYDSGFVEMGCHSYNMHNFKPRYGIAQCYGESDEDYVSTLIKDTQMIQDKLIGATGRASCVYAYPFGKYTQLGRKTLEDLGFKMFLTCNEGVSEIKFANPESVKQLKRINREGSYTTEQLLKKISS